MGISTMFNFRFDPGLCVDKTDVKRILCVYENYILQLNSTQQKVIEDDIQKGYIPHYNYDLIKDI